MVTPDNTLVIDKNTFLIKINFNKITPENIKNFVNKCGFLKFSFIVMCFGVLIGILLERMLYYVLTYLYWVFSDLIRSIIGTIYSMCISQLYISILYKYTNMQ